MICVPFVDIFGSLFHYVVGMFFLVDIVPVAGYPVAGRTHPIHPIQSNAVLKDIVPLTGYPVTGTIHPINPI